jgi:hypothetical protein
MYKEIKIPSKEEAVAKLNEMEEGSVEIELDEDEAKEQVETAEEITLEEAVPEIQKEEIQEDKDEDEAPKAEKKGSSAQRRIRELNARAKEAEARALRAEQEAEELRKNTAKSSKAYKSVQKETLEKNVAHITKQMKDAIEQGEAEAVVNLMSELNDAKIELRILEEELRRNESVNESPAENKKQPVSKVPKEALRWIENYPSFRTDEMFHVSALVVNKQLLNEGFDAEDPEFYEELTKRLSKNFPEVFGIKEKNSVESKESSSDADNKDVKEKPVTKTRVQEQVVSGSSRPSSAQINTPVKKNSVTLSSEEIQLAERWGISLKDMALRKVNLEKNNAGGYAPIMIVKE